MGSHPDNGIVHALHSWKTRAKRAEANHDEAVTILRDLVDRQHDYPTDLHTDLGWGAAFARASQFLKEMEN